MKPFLIYTGLRLALFVATFAVVSTVVVNIVDDNTEAWIWSIVGAAVVSSLLSLKLLAGPRERFAQSVQSRAEKASAAFERARAKEDVE